MSRLEMLVLRAVARWVLAQMGEHLYCDVELARDEATLKSYVTGRKVVPRPQ